MRAREWSNAARRLQGNRDRAWRRCGRPRSGARSAATPLRRPTAAGPSRRRRPLNSRRQRGRPSQQASHRPTSTPRWPPPCRPRGRPRPPAGPSPAPRTCSRKPLPEPGPLASRCGAGTLPRPMPAKPPCVLASAAGQRQLISPISRSASATQWVVWVGGLALTLGGFFPHPTIRSSRVYFRPRHARHAGRGPSQLALVAPASGRARQEIRLGIAAGGHRGRLTARAYSRQSLTAAGQPPSP